MKSEEIKIDFWHITGITGKNCREYHIYYLVRGNSHLFDGKQNFFLNEGDILLILPGQNIQIRGSKENLMMEVRMSVDLFKEIPVQNPFPFMESNLPLMPENGKFVCNSAADRQRDYTLLRRLLSRMAVVSNEKDTASGIYFKALSYMLIYMLWTNFYESCSIEDEDIPVENGTDTDEKATQRKYEIIKYLQENYSEDIRLEDVAGYLNLSVSYLSRYFKIVFKDNFTSFLKKWRLEHSMTELLYTDNTITDIAANNGFGTSNAYIQAFKEIYRMTPNMYRKIHQQKNMSEISENGECPVEKNVSLPLILSDSQALSPLLEEMDVPKKEYYKMNVSGKTEKIIPLWSQGIDVASSRVFMFNDIYSGIKNIQENIGFRYGRVSFVLSGENIFGEDNGKQYFFYHFERILQTFMEYDLIPYLDLNYNRGSYSYGQNGEITVDEERFKNDLTDLIDYWVQTFGVEKMKQWIFDIGILSNMVHLKCEDSRSFCRRYVWAYHMIKSRVPGAKVGGFDIMPQFFMDNVQEILDIILKQNVVPDFISLSAFPYVSIDSGSGQRKIVYASDTGFILKQVKKLKKCLEKYRTVYNFKPEIYINAMGTTITHRNYIDDTCYQSAFLVKNIIDLTGEVDMMCFYQMADFNFSLDEKRMLLNGRNGILSQFGLKKPGYIAFQMMNGLSDQMIAKGDGYMVTRGSSNTYSILMCNHIGLSDWYCLKIDEPLALKDVYTVFDRMDTKSIAFTLEGVDDGEYRIISYHLNRENGSLFDEWEKTGFWETPNARELDYLRTALHPKRQCFRKTAVGGRLDFQFHLQPFEVAVMEVSRYS